MDWLLKECTDWLLKECTDWLLKECMDWLQEEAFISDKSEHNVMYNNVQKKVLGQETWASLGGLTTE